MKKGADAETAKVEPAKEEEKGGFYDDVEVWTDDLDSELESEEAEISR